ncbi:MAG: NAD-dependent epimerase/dehydratase family protein [Elusimicrobia bacterium]|nr:NAD-dependent epimerase/dehydratase family protein [Elusimicrobiota bacterium]
MRALVTGGGGFLGAALLRRLVEGGAELARSLSRGSYPELEKLGVDCVRGDVCDGAAVAKATAGVDTVFHTAGKVGLWGRYQDYHAANVEGTRLLLEACRTAGVRSLVFTGSPSVVFDGGDVDGWDESAPYPARFDSFYSQTKAEAEKLVLEADGPRFHTVSLRPHLIWGPGDRHIAPRVIARARAGQLRRIGGLNKKVDTTYIDDAVDAHLLAAARLDGDLGVGGRAYFISSGDPRPLWDVIDGMLGAAGLPPVVKSVPLSAAKAAAWACEGAYRLLGIESEPRFTRFLVTQLTTAHWFDISAARRDLGYRPRVRLEEGLIRLRASWR